MPAIVIPQHVALRAGIWGSTPKNLDSRFVRSLKTTTTLLSGASQATLEVFVPASDPWPYGLRAMDQISIQAAVTSTPSAPTDAQWQTIWTGYLDDVPVCDAADTGTYVELQASSSYKLLEVTTEVPSAHQSRYTQSREKAGDLIAWACQQVGLSTAGIAPDEADAYTSLVELEATDTAGGSYNPQYLNYATIVASVAKMAGRELYVDETGLLHYRLSQYDGAAVGTIPPERLINVSASVDSDKGIVNRVQVNYGYGDLQTIQHVWEPDFSADIPGYDRAHYRERLLIISAPWLFDQTDADWLARWVLSWAMSNTRPAVVVVNLWPEVRVGQVYTLAWPRDQRTDYYVSSVVHQVTPGGPAMTILGLTYGRAPSVTWSLPPAPSGFGQTGAPPPGQVITSPQWLITYYTPKDPGQAALAQFQDANGTYLLTKYGAHEYQGYWEASASGPLYDYSVRPCGFDATYQIPELGGATLSPGDRLYLVDTNWTVQCEDTGGAITSGAAGGAHLDLFFWVGPGNAGWKDRQTVQFLHVKNYAGTLPDIPPMPITGQPTPPPTPGPGGNGDTLLANFAAATAQSLRLYGGLYQDAGPADPQPPPPNPRYPFADFCVAGWGTLANGHARCQCVTLVRYCLGMCGHPNAPFGNGNEAGNLTGQGYADVTGQLPLPGDVTYWGDTPANDFGHVAIVYSVTPPDAASGQAGSIRVAQANCATQIGTFPLYQVQSAYRVGSSAGFGAWLGLLRPPAQS